MKFVTGETVLQAPCQPAHSKWEGMCDQFSTKLRETGRIIRAHPSVICYPLMLLAVLLGLGIWGVLTVMRADTYAVKLRATSMAHDAASWYGQQLSLALAPLSVMAAIVRNKPRHEDARGMYMPLAPSLLAQAPGEATINLQLVPNGVVLDIYPLKGNEAVLGFDLFGAPLDHDGAVKTVRDGVTTLIGPIAFVQGGFGVIVRQPIFVSAAGPNDTFGISVALNPACGEPCAFNSTTGTKFWGFAAAVISLGNIIGPKSRLFELHDQGYIFQLLAPNLTSGELVVVAGMSKPLLGPSAVKVPVPLPNCEWLLLVHPRSGWKPDWVDGMLVAVVLVSIAMSALTFALLVSRRNHKLLLSALLPKDMIRELRKKSTATGSRETRILEAETPADLLLCMLGQLLEGRQPDLRDVVFIRTALLRNLDVYSPLNLRSHIKSANLDADVASSLMRQLGGAAEVHPSLSMGLAAVDGDGAAISWPDRGGIAGRYGNDGDFGDDSPQEGSQTSWSDPAVYDNIGAALQLVLNTSPSLNYQHHQHHPHQQIMPPGSSMAVGIGGAIASAGSSSSQQIVGPTGTAAESGATIVYGLRLSCSSLQLPGTGEDPAAGLEPRRNFCTSSFNGFADLKPPQQGAATGASPHVSGTLSLAALHPNVLTRAQGCGGRSVVSCGPQLSPACQGLTVGSVTELGIGPSPGQGRKRSFPSGSVGQCWPTCTAQLKAPVQGAMLDEVERLLSCSDGWQFDTWALQEASGGHALSALGFYLMQRAGLIKVFRIQPVKLARLLRRLEAGYPDNPYHNAIHAADVLQTLHVIIHAAQLHVHYLDHLGLLAAYYAAIVHDYGHPGLTNDFLITTSDPLAVRYNDRSPLENHHCAASFGLLLQHPELDFLAGLPPQDRTSFRKMVIELVLSTDMKQHFSILSHFNTVHRLAAYSQQQQAIQQQQQQQLRPQQQLQTPRQPSVTVVTPTTASNNPQQSISVRHGTGSGGSDIVGACDSKPALGRQSPLPLQQPAPLKPVQASTTFAASWSEAAPKPVDETERLLSLQVALKAADIGHLGEDLVVHKRWLGVLEDEFFHQGDRERDLGLPISPLFDRSKQGVSKSQVGFYDFVALPLVHALSSAFPGAQPLMGCLVTNYNHWRTVEGQTTVEIPGVKDRGGGRRGNRGAHLSRSPSGRGGALTAGTEPSSHSQLEQSITSRDADRGGLPAVSRKSLFKAMSTSHERRQPSLRMQDALQPRLEGHDPPAIKLVLAQD